MNALFHYHGPEYDVTAVYQPLWFVAPPLRLAILAVLVVIGAVACTAVWVAEPTYVPSPNICRADEITRTDCIHPTPTVSLWPVGSGVTR
ncbi:hypothetical protein ACIRRA_13515 [Nocardia sp. NPDC101769]|uniref:hypothetical protein n=1 Tax=Nocardia sp. NPDC101769 TaxID=3364333 RepID=UPI0037F7EF68